MPKPPTVTVGPERLVLTDALQPFMARSARGTLWVMGGCTPPPGFVKGPRNAYSSVPGYAVSRDGGRSWQRWRPRAVEGATVGPAELDLPATRHRLGMPLFEGAATALSDGTVLLVEWIADGPDADGNFRAWPKSSNLLRSSRLRRQKCDASAANAANIPMSNSSATSRRRRPINWTCGDISAFAAVAQ